jgi:serine/threonine protein kinase
VEDIMTETKTCPRCGTAIRPGEGPGGLCAACLMKMGFDSRTGTASVVFTEAGKVDRPPAPAVLDLAEHFPELEIRELVAQGGMGCVYRAQQKSLGRDVALKILTVGKDDPSFADRFEREARTLAGLSHPNIVSVFEFGQRGPWTFLIMEFVEGASLRQMMRARMVGSRESLSIVSQICDALQYAHDQGVVHRDIKPENILVTCDGRVKVLDFGLAKLVRGPQLTNLTQTRQVMGTPHYMAPEQWEKPASVDHRVDIYALGVVFYELLTGELPMGRFAPPSHKVAIDVRLDDVVLRSLEKEPARRYQHASEVKDTLTGIAAAPEGNRPEAASEQPELGVVRRKDLWRVVTIGSVIAGALFLFGVVPALAFLLFVLPGHDAPPPPDEPSTRGGSTLTTQHVEHDAPSAYLASGMQDLQITPDVAQRMGLDAAAATKLNATLQETWQRYVDLEGRIVHAEWLPDGWLALRVESAQPEREILLDSAKQRIWTALSGTQDAARWQPALERRVAEQMRFGARDEHLAVEIDGSSSRSRADEGGSETTSSFSSPPDPAYVRSWRHMLPSRPERSK